MTSREERIDKRAEKVKEDEGASHGRNPETMDPEMLDGDDADTVRANKTIKREGPSSSDEEQGLTPGEHLPPD